MGQWPSWLDPTLYSTVNISKAMPVKKVRKTDKAAFADRDIKTAVHRTVNKAEEGAEII